MGCGASAAAPASTEPPVPAAVVEDDYVDPYVLTISTLQTLDFNLVMDDEVAVEQLIEFAKLEFSEENLLFWTDVKKFSGLTAVDELQTAGGNIIDQYLCSSAETMVNLPSKMLAAYSQKSSKGEYTYTADMFANEALEIKKMVEKDTFNRFRLSDNAESLIRKRPLLVLGVEGEGEEKDDDPDDPIDIARKSVVDTRGFQQIKLLSALEIVQELVGCERITLWMLDPEGYYRDSTHPCGYSFLLLLLLRLLSSSSSCRFSYSYSCFHSPPPPAVAAAATAATAVVAAAVVAAAAAAAAAAGHCCCYRCRRMCTAH